MSSTWIIIVSIAGGLVLLLLAVGFVMGRVDRRLKGMVAARFARPDMIQASGANLFGQRSRTAGGIKGTGALVLSRDRLWYGLVVPKREIEIPITSIRSVTTPKSFMDRTIFRELLCVRFSGPDGEDEIAWAVQAPEKWRQAIETVRASI